MLVHHTLFSLLHHSKQSFWSRVNESSINAELTLLSYTLNGNYERPENTDSEYQDNKINRINSNSVAQNGIFVNWSLISTSTKPLFI